jgi:putative heme-binding domain-containing protein
LKREGSGYVGKHETDVFENANEWFRGMEVSMGPDGAIYGLDWSDTGECHDHTGVHRTSGRIYKFFYQKNPVADLSLMENRFDNVEAIIRHPNVWYFRQFLRILTEQNLSEKEKDQIIRICELNLAGNQPIPIRLRALWGLHALNKTISETWLEDTNEHIRAWVIRFMMDEQPIDTFFGPREKALPSANSELLQKLVQQAQTDTSGLVRLTLASSLQRLPVESRGELAKVLASRSEDKNDHNLPFVVWAGITPLLELDSGKLLEVATTSKWLNLRTWIARAITERSKVNPIAFDTLLKLVGDQPEQADSLLAGIERAVIGINGFSEPQKWDEVSSKLQDNPNALKLSTLFGDEQAIGQMEKLVVDINVDIKSRRQTMEILIDSNSRNLRKLSETLLSDPNMKLLGARGLAKFEAEEIGKLLVEKLPEFKVVDQDKLVEIICGRSNWANFLLEKIKKDENLKSLLSPYHAMQIRSLKNEELNTKLEEVWGVVRQSPEYLSNWKKELKKELNNLSISKANLKKGSLLYDQQCAGCHMLYGRGGKLGPDLTGSGRTNLDYLLDNIVDPSSVVSTDYRMNVIELKDGRVLSGMISGQDRNSLTLRMPGSEILVSKSDIKKKQVLNTSIMPAGLLDNIGPDKRRNLIGYLMHPQQVP